MRNRTRLIITVLLLGLGAMTPAWRATALVQAAGPELAAPAALPTQLSDADFWRISSDISEPGGYFRITDNYTSNEREVGRISTMLRDGHVQGGVYLGVGPEQNFSYIAAIQPAMAFVIDIRRQAVMQHLMFKAVFELAKDRSDFIAILFSKPRPAGLDGKTPAQDIWAAFSQVATDPALITKNTAAIMDRLTRVHRFALSAEETDSLQSVLSAFVAFGPSISTRGSGAGGFGPANGGNGGTFADLTGWSVDDGGTPQSFLSTEEHYLTVKTLQEKNLVVPVSGDFGGPKALRAIGAYVKAQGGTISAYYLSNVEQYLFQDGKARAFYDNVATLPLTPDTVFIRPYALRGGARPPTPLCPISSFLTAVGAGRIYSNNDALACTG